MIMLQDWVEQRNVSHLAATCFHQVKLVSIVPDAFSVGQEKVRVSIIECPIF